MALTTILSQSLSCIGCLAGLILILAVSWPLIEYTSRKRLLGLPQSDTTRTGAEEEPPQEHDESIDEDNSAETQRLWALKRLGFVFLLVTGTQWLGAALRTPIFQEYVAVDLERTAREYAVWSIIPAVLL